KAPAVPNIRAATVSVAFLVMESFSSQRTNSRLHIRSSHRRWVFGVGHTSASPLIFPALLRVRTRNLKRVLPQRLSSNCLPWKHGQARLEILADAMLKPQPIAALQCIDNSAVLVNA